MAWQDEMIPVLRVLIGDVDTTNETYTDDSLTNVLLVAAKQVATTLVFTQSFTASVANGILTPDPTLSDTADTNFVNLVTLKGAAILDRTEASLYARQGIVVKDGGSAIDLSKVAEEKRRLLETGWNAVFEDAKVEYLYNRLQGAAGAAILTPYRLFAYESFGQAPFGMDGRSRNYLY